MNTIIDGLFIVVIFYLVLGVYGIIEIYHNKKDWIPEFKEAMKNGGIGFKIYLFLYTPISMTKRIF